MPPHRAEPRRRRRLTTVIVTLLLAVLVLPVAAGAQSGDSSALAEAKRKIEVIKAEIDAAEADASSAGAELADADARLDQVEAAVNEAAAALDRQERAVVEAAAELDRLQADADRIRDAFDRRAADIYKRGSGLPFEIVLTSGNVEEALERSAFIRVITSADTATLEGISNAQISVDAQRDLLEAERTRLESMYEEQQQLYAQVEEIRASKAVAAAAARAEVAELEAEKEDLEADAKAVAKLIAQRSAPSSSVSSPSTSGYSWPLCGYLTSPYGYRWGRMHKGYDIDNNRSSAILSAKGGRVIFAGWQGGYGRLTLIDHGDGVTTAYAHQAAISVSEGQSVSRGQRIGTVGNSGASRGSHLHFETRVNGSAVNPGRFLSGSGC